MILSAPATAPGADDGISFREKMPRIIERDFSDLLGQFRSLLRSGKGLETLSRLPGARRDPPGKAS